MDNVKQFFLELYEGETFRERVWITVFLVFMGACVAGLLCLMIWLGWYIWFMNTHVCIQWSASYWSTDHYGMPVQTRDCLQYSH